MTGDTSPNLDRIKSLTVVELRQELNSRGLEKSGLKADLVKRLEKVSSSYIHYFPISFYSAVLFCCLFLLFFIVIT